MKLWFITCAVAHLDEFQRSSSRLAFIIFSVIPLFSFFFPLPQSNVSHHYQCLVTTLDYAECSADSMRLNDWACPAYIATNVFCRWQNGKSVIFNAGSWAGTVNRQLSL